jgi:hypothetical protein
MDTGLILNALTDGGNPARYWLLKLSTGDWIALAVVSIVGFFLWL